MSGGGGGGTQTNTVSQSIPAFEQQASQQNQALAQSIGSQPFPVYQAPLVQGFTPTQLQGQNMAIQAANAYQPGLNLATGVAQNALNSGQVGSELNAANSMLGAAANGSTTGGMMTNAANMFGAAANGSNTANEAAAANQTLGQATNPYLMAQAGGNAYGAFGQAQGLTNPNAVSAYMSPYIQASLQPSLAQLNLQLAAQQKQIDAGATQAGAYGDARQGAASALNNFYGDMATNQLEGTAYQNAFSAANQALGQAQNTNLSAGQGYNQLGQLGLSEQSLLNSVAQNYGQLGQLGLGEQSLLGNLGQGYTQLGNLGLNEQSLLGNLGQYYNQLAGTGLNEQQVQQAGANQLANFAGLQQSLGETGAQNVYNAGLQQQQLGQQELTNAYQQFMNQVNWPVQMLNIQESALSNSPYNIQTATTLPAANGTAQTIGAVTGLGSLAAMMGGGGPNVFAKGAA